MTRTAPMPRQRKPMKRSQIHRVSANQAKVNRIRAKLTAELITPGVTPCAISSPVCSGMAEHLHHLKKSGQGGSNTKRNGLPACDPCNGYIEDHPTWARARGLVIYSWEDER